MLKEIATTIQLRPYQQDAIERVLAAYQSQPCGGKALIVLPTGGGKTIVFVSIAQLLGLNTLIIAHRQELLSQAADKFRLVDPMITIGTVGNGRHEYGYPVTVASIQTISRSEHLEKLKKFGYGLVIIDESHHSASSGYQAVLDALPSAFVLGVTATPDRLDKKSIESIFGEPVFTASILDLVEQGYLCDLRAIAVHTTTDLSGVHTQAGDFKVDELEEAIDTPSRNERVVNAYLEHGAGRQALCFTVTVEHAQHMAQAFNEQGVRAAFVSGEPYTQPDERRRILSDYERGTLQVVCNCGVLTEGYDAPATSCIILARPTKSRALFMQCIGRGTRLAPGKDDCIILDITDNCLKHRIDPVTLASALELDIEDGESLVEAKKRKRRGEQEREERRTKVTKRTSDLTIDLFSRMDWKRYPGGLYTLTVGEGNHRIKLVPSNGSYSVHAELAPSYDSQVWLRDVTLTDAQQHAEMKARLLQANDKKLVLVDANAPWRTRPATSKQLHLLTKHNIPFAPNITSGEASDLLSRVFASETTRPAKGGKPHGKRR